MAEISRVGTEGLNQTLWACNASSHLRLSIDALRMVLPFMVNSKIFYIMIPHNRHIIINSTWKSWNTEERQYLLS